MSVLVCTFQGRFGNQVMQYLFCRALAERHRIGLRTDPWIGERIFDISHPRPDGPSPTRFNETELIRHINLLEAAHPGFGDCAHCTLEFRGYAQMQQCAVYTKRQAQAWLRLRPEILVACEELEVIDAPIVCHLRRGDYFGYGYPVVAERSYLRAMGKHGFDQRCASFVSEECPTPHGTLPSDLSFVADFFRMMRAPTLLRGNSSFSWLAALLGSGLVLSPNVDGLEGGKEHDCEFVAGNWPRFANLDFVTDLHVNP